MTTPEAPGAAPANALAASPYLRRHAAHPVAWLPWGAEALGRARALDRPILLAVGRSGSEACTRVLEALAEPDTAGLLDSAFVNVVVDADQRPDLDRCYQAAQALLTQQPEAWPLLLFLSPRDQLPFFGGPQLGGAARRDGAGFRRLLLRVAQLWREQPQQVEAQNAALRASLDAQHPPAATAQARLDDSVRQASRAALEQQFDRDRGGFGGAPKHPYPASLERLLRDWRRTATQLEPDLQALYMVALTLTRIVEGGMRDAGGGFFSHALDADWRQPRRELRLADNGALLAVYAQAAVATGEPLFAGTTGATADWLLRELQAADGGFRSGSGAETADAQLTVTSNALAIRGLALAARALRRPELAQAAARAVDDLRSQLWRGGRLLEARPEGGAPATDLPRATLDAHALLADAVLELAQALPRPGDLAFARELLEALLARFEDPAAGGLFLTADDAEPLIHRPKSFADGATPSGNGVAARVLNRLGWLLDEPRLRAAAERVLRAGWPSMQRYPMAHATMIGALEEWLEPPEIVVVSGAAADTARWRTELDPLYAPSRLFVAIEAVGPVSAVVRRGAAASAPLDSIERLARDLRSGLASQPRPEPRGQ